jgi:hypothetical protein
MAAVFFVTSATTSSSSSSASLLNDCREKTLHAFGKKCGEDGHSKNRTTVIKTFKILIVCA